MEMTNFEMTNAIAQALACDASQIRMKPEGFCQVNGERLYLIADLDGMEYSIIRDELMEKGIDLDRYKDNPMVMIHGGLYPLNLYAKRIVLMQMPMSHLDEYEPEER